MASARMDDAAAHKAVAGLAGSEVVYAEAEAGTFHVLVARNGIVYVHVHKARTEAQVLADYPGARKADALSYP